MSITALTCKTIINYLKTHLVINQRRHHYFKNHGIKVLVGLGFVSVIPNVVAQSDLNIAKTNNTSDENAEKQESDSNDGWERLKAMYTIDEFGNRSKELTATIQTTCVACVIGALYGGVGSSREAFRDFMERNQATIFENHVDAKRRLQNHVTIHFGKGAFRWAIKLSAFNAGFMLFLTSMFVYRGGDIRVTDYMISSSIIGALARIRLGPRAALIGGTLGCVLGAICGLSTQGMFYMFHSSFDEVLSFQYELDKSRNNLYKQHVGELAEQAMDQRTLSLLKTHDGSEKVGKEL